MCPPNAPLGSAPMHRRHLCSCNTQLWPVLLSLVWLALSAYLLVTVILDGLVCHLSKPSKHVALHLMLHCIASHVKLSNSIVQLRCEVHQQ
jgi:hypothetical protein